VRRIQDDEPGLVADQAGKLVDVEAEVFLLSQSNGHRATADVVDHGLINWKTRVGIDDLVAFINQRENGKENDRLAARDYDNFLRGDSNPTAPCHFLSNGFAKIGKPGGGPIVRPSSVQSINSRVNDVGRSIEIRLADFEMNDVPA